MAGVRVRAEIIEGRNLAKKFKDGGNVAKPLTDGLRKMTLKLEGEVKKATVVDTGRLRSSISHRYFAQGSEVGTNVQYASFVEYGTKNMEARHMEGGSTKFGMGMFTYAISLIKTWAAREGDDIAKKIAESITHGN